MEKYDLYIGLSLNQRVKLEKITQFSVAEDSSPEKLLLAASKFAQKIRVTLGITQYDVFGAPGCQNVNLGITNVPVWQSYKDGTMYIGNLEVTDGYTGLAVLKKV